MPPGSAAMLSATQEAIDALLTLADLLVWQPAPIAYGGGTNLIAVGRHATYHALHDPSDHEDDWHLTVTSRKTEEVLGRCYPTLATLKAVCRRHALTGDWSDFLANAYDFGWSDSFGYGAVITARLWRGDYRIQRRRGPKIRTGYRYTYAPEYRHRYEMDGWDMGDDSTCKPYQCPYRYVRLDDAKRACTYHHYVGAWRP